MTLADKIVVLRAGIVEQVGTPLTLYDDPDNLFVAGFIGSPRMNFLSGAVRGRDGARAQVQLTSFGDVTIAVPLTGDLPIGKAVTVGIRPGAFCRGRTRQPAAHRRRGRASRRCLVHPRRVGRGRAHGAGNAGRTRSTSGFGVQCRLQRGQGTGVRSGYERPAAIALRSCGLFKPGSLE